MPKYERPKFKQGIWSKIKGEITYNETEDLSEQEIKEKLLEIVQNHYQ